MEQLDDDIWHVAGSSLRMPGGVHMPSASTVLRLPDRSLVVYSPIAFDDATVAALADLGEVAHLIVPNRLHHLFAEQALARWPRAVVHAPPGIRTKRPTLRVDHELGGPAAEWGGALEVERVGGAPRIDEVVVFHRPSRTLVCADLVFHVTRPHNLATRLVLAVMGAGGRRVGQSREWRWACRDRRAARASIERIFGWPIARLAPCHGEPCAIDVSSLAGCVTRLAGPINPLLLAT
jgi:hypothetical protein